MILGLPSDGPSNLRHIGKTVLDIYVVFNGVCVISKLHSMTEATAHTPCTRISNGLAAVIQGVMQTVKSVETTTILNPVTPRQGSATFKNKPTLNSKPYSFSRKSVLPHFFSCLPPAINHLTQRF